MIALLVAAALLAPVTQEEAIKFHLEGRCQMSAPGQGLNRDDGEGWVASSQPGRHRFYSFDGPVQVRQSQTAFPTAVADLAPGYPVLIKAPPHSQVFWCLDFPPSGRSKCGPVPPAFLYDAQRVPGK